MLPIVKNFRYNAYVDIVDGLDKFSFSWDYISFNDGAQYGSITSICPDITEEYFVTWDGLEPVWESVPNSNSRILLWYTDTYFLEYYLTLHSCHKVILSML